MISIKKTKPRKTAFSHVWQILLDCIEIYIPAVAFTIIFIVFMYQIFCRYILRIPVAWSYDLTMTLYIYVIMFGSCYALRDDEHIVFSMIYDACNEKIKLAMRLIGSMFVISVFVLSLPSCFHYTFTIITATIKKTSVLYIPYKYLYFPLLFMMMDTVVRLAVGLLKDIRSIFVRKEETK